MASFDPYFKDILIKEGTAFTNDPTDHGGATKMGVTQAVYDQYRVSKSLTKQSVAKITEVEAKDVYYTLFWLPGSCDKLPAQIAWAHFQLVVNSGVKQASKILQRALGVNDDGVIGSTTITVATIADPKVVVAKYAFFQLSFYIDCVLHDPTQVKFLNGWRNRVKAVLAN